MLHDAPVVKEGLISRSLRWVVQPSPKAFAEGRGRAPRSSVVANRGQCYLRSSILLEKKEGPMPVRKFSISDASFERSPGQNGDVFVSNMVDQRHGAPITVGFSRYEPNQSLTETLVVDDVMVVLEGRLSVTTEAGTVTAGPGEVVHMPKGESVTIRSHEERVFTAYVTYPHWQEARG